MKHLEVRQKYSAARRIFNSLLSVSSGDKTLLLMLDILRQHTLQVVDIARSCAREAPLSVLSRPPVLCTRIKAKFTKTKRNGQLKPS